MPGCGQSHEQRKGVRVRVVSMPSWELFDKQTAYYRAQTLPLLTPTVVVEAGVSQGWHKYTGPMVRTVTIDNTFGASAPFKDVYRAYGFSIENVVQQAMTVMR